MNMDVKRRRQQRIKELDPQQSWQEWRLPPTRKQFVHKCMIGIIIYLLLWTIFHLDDLYAQRMQHFVREAMNKSFDYVAIDTWYKEHIGEMITFLPTFNGHADEHAHIEYSSPALGETIQNDTDNNNIIRVQTGADQSVATIARGLVQYAGPSSYTGMTVIVRHSNGIQSIYDGLQVVQVEKNDWLEGGVEIGKANILYFALKKHNEYVNPRDVIPFD
jgi:stage IV sporulation protein FA